MRLRFAVSGHAAKVEVKEPAAETKEAAHETARPAKATNNETRIEAATGG
jgi:two-component system nitrogen regulation sensor histidine kinase NtrY